MFKKLMNKKFLKNQKGLTLVELLAVIVILAIISAIAIPSIGNIIENSRYNAVKADAVNVLNAAHIYYTDSPDAADGVKVSELKTANYLESIGKMDPNATIKKSNPKELTSKVVKYSGDKAVTFSSATIESINADKQKGSADKISDINATPAP